MASPHPIHDYIAGALGGAAGLVVGHPFDTVKVQQQVRQTSSPYKGIFDALRNVNRQGMVRGYFRGLAFPLASYGITNSLFFGAYGNTIRWLCGMDHKPTYSDIFIAGCVGGVAQLTVACPADVVKVVMQAQIPKAGETGKMQNSAVKCFIEIFQSRGLKGTFRGLNTQAARDIPASGIYIMMYEFLRDNLKDMWWNDKNEYLACLASGGLAGAISWVTLMPVDVIKSIIQADALKKSGGAESYMSCAKDLYEKRGVKGFFTGMSATSVRAFPVNAVTFLVYEEYLKYAGLAR